MSPTILNGPSPWANPFTSLITAIGDADLRFLDHAALVQFRLNPSLTGSVYRNNGGSQIIDTWSGPQNGTGSFAANRVAEWGFWGASPQSASSSDVDGGFTMLGNATRVVTWMRMIWDGAQFGQLHAGTCFGGFQFGSFGANAPWTGLTTTGIIQARMMLTGGRNTMALCTGTQGNVPTVTTGNILGSDGAIYPAGELDNVQNLVLLDWVPGSYVDLWFKPTDMAPQRVVHVADSSVLSSLAAQQVIPVFSLVSNTGSSACGVHFSVAAWWIAILGAP